MGSALSGQRSRPHWWMSALAMEGSHSGRSAHCNIGSFWQESRRRFSSETLVTAATAGLTGASESADDARRLVLQVHANIQTRYRRHNICMTH